MLSSHIDHLVITAPTLAQGTQYLNQALGVSAQTGGEHPRMGTHNSLLRLGPDLYVEVIACNPQAPQPAQPRWFQLDDTKLNNQPRLATWVARTNDIQAAHATANATAHAATSIQVGHIKAMTRAHLEWQITITADGVLPMQGIAPAFIQWNTPTHPAASMQDTGCSLLSLDGYHPDAQVIQDMLHRIGFEGKFSVHSLPAGAQPYLIAHIQTPNGPRQLGGDITPNQP